MRGICEGVEHHLWSSDSHPADRGIHALRSSKSIPRCTAVRGWWALDRGVRNEGPPGSLFERLDQADPPAVELDVRGVTISIADPPNKCGPPSFVETQLR